MQIIRLGRIGAVVGVAVGVFAGTVLKSEAQNLPPGVGHSEKSALTNDVVSALLGTNGSVIVVRGVMRDPILKAVKRRLATEAIASSSLTINIAFIGKMQFAFDDAAQQAMVTLDGPVRCEIADNTGFGGRREFMVPLQGRASGKGAGLEPLLDKMANALVLAINAAPLQRMDTAVDRHHTERGKSETAADGVAARLRGTWVSTETNQNPVTMADQLTTVVVAFDHNGAMPVFGLIPDGTKSLYSKPTTYDVISSSNELVTIAFFDPFGMRQKKAQWKLQFIEDGKLSVTILSEGSRPPDIFTRVSSDPAHFVGK